MQVKVSIAREDFIMLMSEFASFDIEDFLSKEEFTIEEQGMLLMTFIREKIFEYDFDNNVASLIINVPSPRVHLTE